MSIAAPATNPASDLELKLPATIGAAGQALINSSTPGTLEFGKEQGVTFAVQYAIDSNITLANSGGFVVMPGNNLRQQSYSGAPGSTFAAGFSVGNTSGTVTFPETGLYYLHLNGDMVVTNDNIRSASVILKTTTDNSTYNIAARRHFSINRPTGTTSLQQCGVEYLFDVTNTTNCKARFGAESDNIGQCWLQADSNVFLSGFTIMKLRGT